MKMKNVICSVCGKPCRNVLPVKLMEYHKKVYALCSIRCFNKWEP